MMRGIEFLAQDMERDVKELRHFIALSGAKYVIIPSNPRNKASASSLIAAQTLRERLLGDECERVKIVPTISGAGLCGEQGRARFISEILGVKYAGFDAVAIIGGESEGVNGAVGGVAYDVARGAANGAISGAISGVEGISLAREILGEEVVIISGSSVAIEQEAVLKRLEAKLQAGANHIITQPLFSMARAEAFMRKFCRIRAACGSAAMASLNIFGVFDKEVAHRINHAWLGFCVEEAYMEAAFGSIKDKGMECDFSESGRDFENIAKERALGAFVALREGLMRVAHECEAGVFLSSAKHNDERILKDFRI